jgi:hypothetical protein
MLYPVCVKEKYGYIDARGKVAIKAQFELAGKFSEDRACVATIDPTRRDGMLFLSQCGFIDTKGELVVSMKYNEARPFHGGLPLPTLPFPQVTKFDIVYPTPKLSVRLNDSETILVHTDADAEFDAQRRFAIRAEPDCLELAAKSKLNGGRIRWRLRPRQTSASGDIGKVIISVTKPDGSQLTSTIDFEVLAALEQKTKKAKGLVPKFDVIPINPVDDAEQWAAAWPDLDDNATPEELASVAYKPVSIGGSIVVYYSTIFSPFQEQVEKLKQESAALPSLFRTNYEIWIGYHAILQENARAELTASMDDEQLDRILEDDRTRVARMQVKQARSTAELMHKAMQERAADAEA